MLKKLRSLESCQTRLQVNKSSSCSSVRCRPPRRPPSAPSTRRTKRAAADEKVIPLEKHPELNSSLQRRFPNTGQLCSHELWLRSTHTSQVNSHLVLASSTTHFNAVASRLRSTRLSIIAKLSPISHHNRTRTKQRFRLFVVCSTTQERQRRTQRRSRRMTFRVSTLKTS